MIRYQTQNRRSFTAFLSLLAVSVLSIGQALGQATDVQCAQCVDRSDMAAKSVSSAKLGNSAVTTDKIAAGAVTTNKIGANAVSRSRLRAAAVSTGKLQAAAVTTDKIADDAVSSAKIADGSITGPKIAAGAVALAALAADARTNVAYLDMTNTFDVNIPIAVDPTFLRNAGIFDKQSDASNVLVFYQDHLQGAANAICALQIRIDGNPSAGIFGPPIITNFTTSNEQRNSFGLFTGLTAGQHAVDVYYRNLNNTCNRNSGGWNPQVLLIEIP